MFPTSDQATGLTLPMSSAAGRVGEPGMARLAWIHSIQNSSSLK